MDNKTLLIGGGLLLAALVGGGAYWLWGAPTPVAPGATEVADACKPKSFKIAADDFTIGDANAPITLVEFYSQTCSHCAAFHQETFPKLNEAYIKTGVVRLVLRDFQRNKVDLAASLVGRCMSREAFIPFTDMLLDEQKTWLTREDRDIRAGLKDMAKRAGLSGDDFEACLTKKDEAAKLVEASASAQKDFCIDGTPTLLMNGKKLESAAAFDKLDGYIKDEMKALGVKAETKAEAPAKTNPAP